MSVELAELHLGPMLGSGGQAEVFQVSNRPGLVFKRYLPHVLAALNAEALRGLVAEEAHLQLEGHPISYWATWPTEVVVDHGATIGFLMPIIEPEFFLSQGRLAGLEASFSYLACEPAPFWGDVELPDQQDRLILLAKVAGVLQSLHHCGLVFGDISWNNILWSTQQPRVLFLDCDGVFADTRRAFSVEFYTPDFDDPLAVPGSPPDADRDCYKFSLLVLRVLSRQLTARPDHDGAHDLRDLLPEQEERIQEILRRSAAPPQSRPTATEWRHALLGRAMNRVQPPIQRPRLVVHEPEFERTWRAVTPPKPPAAPLPNAPKPTGQLAAGVHRRADEVERTWYAVSPSPSPAAPEPGPTLSNGHTVPRGPVTNAQSAELSIDVFESDDRAWYPVAPPKPTATSARNLAITSEGNQPDDSTPSSSQVTGDEHRTGPS